MIGALALAPAACTSVNLSTPTGCVATRPDPSTYDPGGPCAQQCQCAVLWTCNSATQTYQIECELQGDNYYCECNTNTVSTRHTITLNPFACDLAGGALIGANACGWDAADVMGDPERVPQTPQGHFRQASSQSGVDARSMHWYSRASTA